MKTTFFVILKFGHDTKNSLASLRGTGVSVGRMLTPQTGYQTARESPVRRRQEQHRLCAQPIR